MTICEQSVSVNTIINDPVLQVNDVAMSASKGELHGLLAHNILMLLR